MKVLLDEAEMGDGSQIKGLWGEDRIRSETESNRLFVDNHMASGSLEILPRDQRIRTQSLTTESNDSPDTATLVVGEIAFSKWPHGRLGKNTVQIPSAVSKTRPGYAAITAIHSAVLFVYLTRCLVVIVKWMLCGGSAD